MKFFRTLLRVLFFIILGLVSVFIILFFATSGDQRVAKTVAEDPSIPHITVDGVTFHAESYGPDTAEM